MVRPLSVHTSDPRLDCPFGQRIGVRACIAFWLSRLASPEGPLHPYLSRYLSQGNTATGSHRLAVGHTGMSYGDFNPHHSGPTLRASGPSAPSLRGLRTPITGVSLGRASPCARNAVHPP